MDSLRERTRRPSSDQARTRRLTNTIRLPWIVGLVVFLLLALATALLIGRTGDAIQVPQAILDDQESIARSSAQSVRRSVNEGVDDLRALSMILGPLDPGNIKPFESSLNDTAEGYDRYLALYLIDAGGEVLASAGGSEPRADTLDLISPFAEAGMGKATAQEDSKVPVILQYAPLQKGAGEARALVGQYDPSFFRFSLEAAEPSEVWLVDKDGRVIGSREGFTAFQGLPRQPLREAAEQAAGGDSGATVVPSSLGRQEIVSFAPVAGPGLAGDLGWSVVTARSVDSIALPETNAQRNGLLIAGLLALFTVLIFGWLYISVLRPLFSLQEEAERLAYGDLSRSVRVFRYDEIGVIARTLERIRVLLIRRRVQEREPSQSTSSEERED
jgi:HAMP domain-containing protein